MNAKIALWLSWALFVGLFAGAAAAVTTGPWSPSGLAGCRVVDGTPTYSAGQLVGVTCNTSGQVRVTTS